MKFNYKKNIKAPLIGLSMVIGLSSCQKDFGDINKSWNSTSYVATIPAMYNNIASTMLESGQSRTIVSSFLYQNTQLAANFATSGFRLDDQVGTLWNNYYFALANARKLEVMIDEDIRAPKMTNVKAMLKTLMAYKALKTTQLFGDMPYTQAGKVYSGPDFYRPVYDKQADIFAGAIADLKWAIDNFSTNADQVSLGASENIFNGDIATWIKFANSLRLRYAMAIRDKNATLADPIIAEALTKPLLVPGDNLGMYPSKVTNLVLDRSGSYRGNNNIVRMGSTMWSAMSSSNATDGSGIYDLRCKIFFEPNKAGQWVPYPQAPTGTTTPEINGDGPYQASRTTTWVTPANYLYSPLNYYYIADKTFPDLFITAAEVSFLKAEIYNRGIAGITANPATAKAFYEEGIAESVKFWYKTANSSTIWAVNKPAAAPTAAELTAMLTNPAVAYSATPATALAQIYKQNWIALFHQPFEAWMLQRRTGATPNVQLSPDSHVLNMNKLNYPASESSTNFDNWKAVTGGTNDMSVKPWFMK
ncbi:SusD/RagB family nutrient-binding outer membrane lipoprotein [Solitalea lacus]|uniref:SusD/RagB family nutrient-binding outer membrane lipoprotein n=1 Tax=Solitalea lacus TaxID=2911172 RepID=UPI001EDC0805|nr:SusD/RagB family nutrient-binding outer membrane lipoprotein [Solitalea lacus]UKJ07671.1 SusD/RagB family nutrient-binding outer membrane lipoprotein [Solitalea lacus]